MVQRRLVSTNIALLLESPTKSSTTNAPVMVPANSRDSLKGHASVSQVTLVNHAHTRNVLDRAVFFTLTIALALALGEVPVTTRTVGASATILTTVRIVTSGHALVTATVEANAIKSVASASAKEHSQGLAVSMRDAQRIV